mgnify:CR=1 FL=1
MRRQRPMGSYDKTMHSCNRCKLAGTLGHSNGAHIPPRSKHVRRPNRTNAPRPATTAVHDRTPLPQPRLTPPPLITCTTTRLCSCSSPCRATVSLRDWFNVNPLRQSGPPSAPSPLHLQVLVMQVDDGAHVLLLRAGAGVAAGTGLGLLLLRQLHRLCHLGLGW